jgi:hypothetical protein
MDAASSSAARLLAALLDVREELRALAGYLRNQPEVTAVVTEFDMWHTWFWSSDSTLPEVEIYVDAVLQSGNGISCFVKLRWDAAQWTLEREIRRNRCDLPGNELQYLVQFPRAETADLDELIAVLNQGATELVVRLKSIDLKPF